jgi:DNA-binding MarR family transcriptional regulator
MMTGVIYLADGLARYNNAAYLLSMSDLRREPIFLLHDVARMMRTRFDKWARGYGMTRAQAAIVFRLSRQPGMSQNEMAALLEVEPITVGRLVDRLEARGLVERRADPGDRRIRRLHLLPAAQPILTHIENYTDEIIEILLGETDPRAVQTMLDVLQHMKNKLATESAGEKIILAGE